MWQLLVARCRHIQTFHLPGRSSHVAELWAVRWREMCHFQDKALREALWLFCHSLHPPASTVDLPCGPGENRGPILGIVELKDGNGATDVRAK